MGAITLPNFRTTADVTMNTRLKDGGVSIDWAGLTNIKAWLFSDAQKAIAGRCDVSINQADSTKLVCLYSASKPQYLGIQRLIVQAKYMGQTKTYDVPAFNFVSRTAAATGSITIDEPTVDVSIEVTDISSSIIDDALRAVLAATDEAMDAAALATTKAAEAQAASEQAAADHIRAGSDHTQAASDHTQAASDHAQAGTDHERAESDHGTASTDHTQAASDHNTAAADHTTAGQDHTRAATDHDTAATDHTLAAADHTQAGTDHSTAAADHTAAASDHTRAGQDHTQAAADHTQAGEDHTQAQADHAVMAGYDNRLSAVEGDVTELERKVGFAVSTSLRGNGSSWAILNDTHVFEAGKPLTVKLTGPLTFAGTADTQTFLRLYTKHADTQAEGVSLVFLKGVDGSFSERTVTFTPSVDVKLSVEGRWQTTEVLTIEVFNNIIQQVATDAAEIATLETTVSAMPNTIKNEITTQQNLRWRGTAAVVHSGGINFNNTTHQAEIQGMILASRAALNTRLTVNAVNVDYSFNANSTTAVWLCYNLSQSAYRFVSAGQNDVNDIFIAALHITGNSAASPNNSKVLRVLSSPVNYTIDGVSIDSRVAALEAADVELAQKARGTMRAFECNGINFNNTTHKAEVSPLLFSNPANNYRLTVNAAEVPYTFSQSDTTAVWLVYNTTQSTHKFISAGTIAKDELFLAALVITGRPTETPDSTKVLSVNSSPVPCTIDGVNTETRIADVIAEQDIESKLLGKQVVTPNLGLLSNKTIYQHYAQDSTDCLCYQTFVRVLCGVVNCYHAAGITVRVIEYDQNRNYITQTGYGDLGRVVLRSNTEFIRIAANYSGKGYGASNPISVDDFTEGDFGLTFPGSTVSDKVRGALIDSYDEKPYFVDGSTWRILGTTFHVRIIQVTAGKKILVKSNNSVNTRIAFLNSFDEDYILENAPCAIDGLGNRNTTAGGNITMYTIPNTCTHIALSSVYGGANALPVSLIIDGVEYMSPSVADLRSVIEYFDSKTDPEIETKINNIEKGVLTSILGRNMVRDAAVRATGVKAVTEDIKPFSFIHVSDIHTKSGNFKCFKNACEFYQHYGNIAIMIATGDLVWDDNRDSMDYYDEALASTSKPVLNVVGNHDSGQWHVGLQSVTTDKQCYDKVIAPYVSGWGVVQPADAATNGKSYYYKDFTDQKVRLIVINEFETDYEIDPNDATRLKYSREYRAMRQAQVTWLINTLAGTPSDYGVIVAMHQPLGLLKNENNPFVSFDLVDSQRVLNVYSSDTEWLAKIIDAYARKTSLSLTVSQTGAVVTTLDCSCDFSSVESEFICVICGHTHRDYIGHLKNYPNIPILCVGADNLQYTSTFQPRAEGTPSEDLFNVVNVDRNRKTIKIIRIGSDASVTGQVRDQMLLNYGTQSL